MLVSSSLRASSSSSSSSFGSSSSSSRTLSHLLSSSSTRSYTSSKSSRFSGGSISGSLRTGRVVLVRGQAQDGRVTEGRRTSRSTSSSSLSWSSGTTRGGNAEGCLVSRRPFSSSLPPSLHSSLPSSFTPPPPPSPSPEPAAPDLDPDDPDNMSWNDHTPLIPVFQPSRSDPSPSDLGIPLTPSPSLAYQPPTPSVPPSNSTEPQPYTPAQAAKSLSELKLRLDALIEASEGDLDVAENALERLASELGREKDLAVNVLPSGKRKPSFAPHSALGRKDVQRVTDGWEMELEKAIVLAMHPRSLRFSKGTRNYLTKTIHGVFVLSPARVAALVARTTMALILERTSVLSTNSSQSHPPADQAAVDLQTLYARKVKSFLRGEEAEDSKLQTQVDAMFEIKTVTLAKAIAEQLEMEYLYAQGALKEEHDAGVRLNRFAVEKKLREGQEVMDKRKEAAKNLAVQEEGLSLPMSGEESEADGVTLGAELITLVLDVWSLRAIGIKERPFSHQLEIKLDERDYKSSKLLRPSLDLVRLLVRAAPDAKFMARDLPMIAPPRLWPTAKNGLDRKQIGGYHVRRTTIVKKMNRPDRKADITGAMERGEMDEVLEAVNIISANKWNVRSPVLDVILQAVSTESFLEDVVDGDAAKPSSMKGCLAAIRSHVKTTHLLPLNIARAFEGRDFYLPHNLDYRGRIYSLSPYLHPCGDDVSRGLLTFGNKKKLGKDGFWWLKIHLSGVYGEDKISFEDRVAWVDARMNEVLASAKDPIHNDWWLHGDKPFQTLAACFEISDAYHSPNHEEFESSLPVHMDGTCNGLQYYAALGRDVKGGKSVNLLPSDLPQDVYGEVLQIVKETVAKEKDEDKWEDLKGHAWLLTRKTVKTTVMTSVYGVTQVGAQRQVEESLAALVAAEKEKGTNVGELESQTKIYDLSKNLATLILSSIDKLFPVATSIQEWLGTCLQLVVKAGSAHKREDDVSGNSMEWTSPLGLPIVQAYREIKSKAITTRLQSVSIVDDSVKGRVLDSKEKNGFAPNFIHSLDATHLFMTAKACNDQGVTFGSVHDSFWTHAATVPALNATLRDEFVRLHSSDPAILERLRNQLLERFGQEYIDPSSVNEIRKSWKKTLDQRNAAGVRDDGSAPWPRWAVEANPVEDGNPAARIQLKHVFPPVPSRGELDIEEVKNSRYFFK